MINKDELLNKWFKLIKKQQKEIERLNNIIDRAIELIIVNTRVYPDKKCCDDLIYCKCDELIDILKEGK